MKSLFLASVFILSTLASAATAAEMGPAVQSQVTWTLPCGFADASGRPVQPALSDQQCDYILSENLGFQAGEDFNTRFNVLPAEAQAKYLARMRKEADAAFAEYKRKKGMLLAATDPEKVTAGKSPEQRVKVLLDLKSQLYKYLAENAKPFCTHRFQDRWTKYSTEEVARATEIDREIAAQKKEAGVKDKARIEKMETAWQSNMKNGFLGNLKKSGSGLKGKSINDAMTGLNKEFDGSSGSKNTVIPGGPKVEGPGATEEEMKKLFGAGGKMRDQSSTEKTYAQAHEDPPALPAGEQPQQVAWLLPALGAAAVGGVGYLLYRNAKKSVDKHKKEIDDMDKELEGGEKQPPAGKDNPTA